MIKCRKTEIGIRVLLSRSDWCVNFLAQMVKGRVTVRVRVTQCSVDGCTICQYH